MGIEIQKKKDDLPVDGPDRGVLIFPRKLELDGQKQIEGIELFPVSKGVNAKKEAQERKAEIEAADQKLQVEDLREFINETKNGKYQITTDVSGEKYTFTMESFYKGKEAITDRVKMMADLEQNPANIKQLTAGFNCVEITGRPETLKLDYKINVIDLISGSTNLAERIKQTFAGTHDHYKKIYQDSEKVELTEQQKQQRSTKMETVANSLRDQNYTVSETTYEGGPTILHAFIPGQERQITISSFDGAVLSLTAISQKGERQKSLVTPNELLNTLNSEELW